MWKLRKELAIMFLALIGLSLTSFSPDRGSSNLASEHSFAGYTFTGKVLDVSSSLPITIKFVNLNHGATSSVETVKLCKINDMTIETVALHSKLKLFSDARKDGRLLKVSFNSLFDRCLTGVTQVASARNN